MSFWPGMCSVHCRIQRVPWRGGLPFCGLKAGWCWSKGRWMTGAGLSAADCTALLRQYRKEVSLQVLDDQALWGRAITDERYLLLSCR
jgi:hypothetical protein